MRFLIYASSFIYGYAGLVIVFLYVLRGGKYEKGIVIGWGLKLTGACFAALILPNIASIHNHEYIQFFPEAIVIPPLIIFGWLEPAIVTIIAGLLREVIIRFKPNSKIIRTNKTQTGLTIYAKITLFYLIMGVLLLLVLLILPAGISNWPYNVTNKLTMDSNTLFAEYISDPIPPFITKIKADKPG